MSGRFVIMGSGETTNTMVTPHQRIVTAVSDGAAISMGGRLLAHLLDTPYGFQENADELTEKTVAYFADRVGLAVTPLRLRRADEPSAVELETVLQAARDAGWLFCGPGSPSYLMAQWAATPLPQVLRDRVRRPVATVFASAAAVTLGRFAMPVYEIYKVGHDPYWVEGLDLTGELGWDCVVVPHYDNAEGGTHDTRHCYVGNRRLEILEADLPDTTWILGVDEHTAAIIDPGAGTLEVAGRGGVTARYRDRTARWESGRTVALDQLPEAVGVPGAAGERTEPRGPIRSAVASFGGRATATTRPSSSVPRGTAGTSVRDRREAFDEALAKADALGATEHVLGLESSLRDSDAEGDAVALLRSMVTRLGRLADEGLHDHDALIAPHVEHLLTLRQEARADGRYADADAIRDALIAAGIEVKDTPDGSEWSTRS